MNELMYLGGILSFRVLQKISNKAISNDMPGKAHGVSAYLSMSMGMSAAVAFILLLFGDASKDIVSMPPEGWGISVATGVTLTISVTCSLFALRGSSMVLGALFGMAGLLVPIISGIFIFGQSVSPMQWGGILLLFIAAWLLASSSEKTNGKLTLKTLFLLLGSMLSNGGTMLLQTLYKHYVPEGNVSLYSFLQFLIPAVTMLILTFILRANGKVDRFRPSKKLVIFTAISAVSLLAISQLSTMASAVVPVAVLFPVSDGGGMIISAIVASVMYKEKLNVKSVIGIAAGILAIVSMKVFGA